MFPLVALTFNYHQTLKFSKLKLTKHVYNNPVNQLNYFIYGKTKTFLVTYITYDEVMSFTKQLLLYKNLSLNNVTSLNSFKEKLLKLRHT